MTWFSELDLKFQAIVISALVTLVTFSLVWMLRLIYKNVFQKLKLTTEIDNKENIQQSHFEKKQTQNFNPIEKFNFNLWNFTKS